MTERGTLTLAGIVPPKNRKPSDVRRSKARLKAWREKKRTTRAALRAARRAVAEAGQ